MNQNSDAMVYPTSTCQGGWLTETADTISLAELLCLLLYRPKELSIRLMWRMLSGEKSGTSGSFISVTVAQSSLLTPPPPPPPPRNIFSEHLYEYFES